MRASASISDVHELPPVPREPRHADTRELRLALVCFGGVSLAIYMHGVTKEIHKLVAASVAYEADQERNPFEPHETEHVYWRALQARERRDEANVRTRVIVDVIAGTSAGGINGIILAKSLAHDLPQEALRDVWLERGDVKQLMALSLARRLPSLPLKLLTWAAWSALTRLRPPLDGDRMFGWIHEALERMDDAGGEGGHSLMPAQHPLELFVTVTDFHGYDRRVPIHDPTRVNDLRHRHVLVFTARPGKDQLGRDYNAELAFAARATSSFPGAFPPINVANIAQNVPGWSEAERFEREFYAIYPLSGAELGRTHFVDGGVLDNFPFAHAIAAIRARPAAVEVDRRLIYIEPDPAGLAKPPSGEPPEVVRTIWGGLSEIPAREPILDDLLAVRVLNERIDRIEEIVNAALRETPELVDVPEPDGYADANGRANVLAAERAGFSHAAYVQLKLYSVVERFAGLACEVCGFPLDSNHAFFVRDVLIRWARRVGLLTSAASPSDRQLDFLRTFDLAYAERRLRFVITRLSDLYAGTAARPTRQELNAAKQRLYEHAVELAAVGAEAGTNGRGDGVRRLFTPARVREYMDRDEDPLESASRFAEDFKEQIDGIESGLGRYLEERLGDFGERVYRTLLSVTEGWDQGVRHDLLIRYLGFPFWDVLVFPIMAVGEVGELNRVEVVRFSPEDVCLLRAPGQVGERPTAREKLRGVAAGHFAAFFSRDRRENDYLWGRLDGAERLFGLLLGSDSKALCYAAFEGILAQEGPELRTIADVVADLERQVEEGAR